jgi:hypothetical protein
MSARGRYFGTVNGPLWFWDPIDDRATADKWLTHPFERREDWHPHPGPFGTIMVLDKDRLQALEAAFEQFLDQLAEDFGITDRATLKEYIELAMRTYNIDPDELPKGDADWFLEFAPKMASILLRNVTAFERIVANFDQQHMHGFSPEYCKTAHDQGEVDGQIRQASHTLMRLARTLSQQRSKRGQSPNVRLYGAVGVLKEYWVRKLGRKLKAGPWKGDAARFVKIIFNEVIDPAAVESLPNAMRGRVKGLGKNTP